MRRSSEQGRKPKFATAEGMGWLEEQPCVLLVEDSKLFASVIEQRVRRELGLEVVTARTYDEAVSLYRNRERDFFLALLDLTLPDAPDGEIVDYLNGQGVPCIIFTSGLDGSVRERLWTRNVVDYILKDSNVCVDNLIATVRRIQKNSRVGVLVVDDAKASREIVDSLLRPHRFRLYEAGDGEEALQVLREQRDIKLVITDYDMPKMDGVALIRALRREWSRDELGIIGMSASDNPLLSAHILKTGANDFIPKPFMAEEFHCRVIATVETIERIELIRDLSNKDPLTRLYNRRYFFDHAEAFIERAIADGQDVTVAMMDIDHFKVVNDTHGHDGGDKVLRVISRQLATGFGDEAIVCRFGGEEFCVLLAHRPGRDAVEIFNDIRVVLSRTDIEMGSGKSLRVTISAGVCGRDGDLDARLKCADECLYKAKDAGRNRVVSA